MENDGATMLPLIHDDEGGPCLLLTQLQKMPWLIAPLMVNRKGMVLDVDTRFRLPVTNLPLKETKTELLLEFMIGTAIFDFCQLIQAVSRQMRPLVETHHPRPLLYSLSVARCDRW
ncbi:hypothetical protein ACLOJK_034999 [Asimina triloba]